MKKTLLTLSCCLLLLAGHAQTDSTTRDTARAIRIIDNYLSYIDFSPLIQDDSMLCVVTKVTYMNHPGDTLTIYRWYHSTYQCRIEMWPGKRMEEGLYSDGKSLFRTFDNKRRSWYDITRETFFNKSQPMDIRGALFNWRSKGAETYYVGVTAFENHEVDHIFFSSPGTFNRHYYFDKENGLPFLVTEEESMFGDDKPTKTSERVDWRAWHEFTPFNGYLLPTVESYQAHDEIVVMHHTYHLEAYRKGLFTDDFRKQ